MGERSIMARGAIPVTAVAGGAIAGEMAVMRFGGKYAPTSKILRAAVLPAALGAAAGGAMMDVVLEQHPAAAPIVTTSVGGGAALIAVAGAVDGVREFRAASPAQRHGLGMGRYVASNIMRDSLQLPMVALVIGSSAVLYDVFRDELRVSRGGSAGVR